MDELDALIDWAPVSGLLARLYPATKGEPAWLPLAMFKALLLSVWYDLSDVKLAEALDDRASSAAFAAFPAPKRRRSAPPSCASASFWSHTGSMAASSKR